MAIDLKDEEKFTTVTVKYEDFEPEEKSENAVFRDGHAEDWKTWEERGDAIDSHWDQMEKILLRDPCPFEVEDKTVPAGTGEVPIKWTLRTEASNLVPGTDFEMYSVMRAEYKFLNDGYTKLASKYWTKFGLWRKGEPVLDADGEQIEIERYGLGIDNFFKRGDEYIVCESKFMGSKAKFKKEIKQNNGASDSSSDSSQPRIVGKYAWHRLATYKKKGIKFRQMSWEWIRRRAVSARRFPDVPPDASPEQEERMGDQIEEMETAVKTGAKISRILNIYGADKVPVYPGRYVFRLDERFKLSENELEVKWTIDLDDREFFDLDKSAPGDDEGESHFDAWCEQQAKIPKRKTKKRKTKKGK